MIKIRAFYVYLVVVFTLMIIVVDQNNRSKVVLKNLSKFTKKPPMMETFIARLKAQLFYFSENFSTFSCLEISGTTFYRTHSDDCFYDVVNDVDFVEIFFN